ncbi:hypothetical protein [Halosimplex amylolyticum]|uniref:hypothetical protein n=1 Tax=Halosimplex amylolyticum TaxID=3396616 RepID=UPI003F543BA5
MTDEEDASLSRRSVLAGITSVGAASAIGAGTGALFRTDARTSASFASGSLDLRAAWTDGGTSVDLGTVEAVGDGGRKRVALSIPASDNPAYVWFRTTCRRCSDAEEHLDVSISIETETGGTTTIDRDRLGVLRDRLGTGTRLPGLLSPGETRWLVVEWELREPLQSDGEVDFDLDFFAVQARNVEDSDDHGPAWVCPPGSCAGSGPAVSDVSWVGFCADSGAAIEAEDFEFTVDGPVLDLTEAPAELGSVLLKYGTRLDVFRDPPFQGSFAAGTADETYAQQGAGFSGTGRSNPTPCPGRCGLKYDVDGGNFESKGCDS